MSGIAHCSGGRISQSGGCVSTRLSRLGCPYDEAKFLRHVGENRELGDQLTDLFLESCPKFLADMGEALDQGDLPALERLAHGIKGSVGVFGAEDCLNAAAEVEKACHDVNFGAAQEAMAMLRLEIHRLSSVLGERIEGRVACEF